MGGASAVRRSVLRARGDGEPDQGAVQSVCRSRQQRDDARQSDAHVLFGDGLRAGVRIAPFGFEGHRVGKAQAATIRTRLLKIGAQVRVSVRRISLSMAASYPWASLFTRVHAQLRAVAAYPQVERRTAQPLLQECGGRGTGRSFALHGYPSVFSARFRPYGGLAPHSAYTRCRGVCRFSHRRTVTSLRRSAAGGCHLCEKCGLASRKSLLPFGPSRLSQPR